MMDDTPGVSAGDVEAKLASGKPDVMFIDYLGPVSYTHLDVYKRQGVCIAHPPVVTGDAFIVAAVIHAGLVVVRAFALTHQDAHSLRHIHRYAVKAAVRGKRQRVHRCLLYTSGPSS